MKDFVQGGVWPKPFFEIRRCKACSRLLMWRVWRIGRYCVSHRDMIGDSNGDWYCANNYHLNTCSLTSTLLATSHPKYTDLKRWLNEGNRLAILCVYGMTIEQAEEYVKECEK